ncbi:uncharacterized protein LOC135370954 [Ornithodoros turicata]|uniref:uncharacterized protein LOC135370954 n=1 Tax=Ornithodoros turicata TaxID=34597 RepID=UPI003139B79F
MDDNDVLATIEVLLLTVSLILRKRRSQTNQSSRRYWVRPVLRYRDVEGQASGLLPRLRSRDVSWFRDFIRMPPRTFDTLLGLVQTTITRADTSFRKAIPASDRLALTLRFLAEGSSVRGTSFNFLVGRSTASKIISDTCEAIWECLAQQYLWLPSTSEEWKEIARDMEAKWNFPNCLGSIDGKHVTIQCPPKSGSTYFNYKKSFSIVLLAVCDGGYRFTYVDIGHMGSESDGGIFARSQLKEILENSTHGIPSARPVGSAGTMSYFIVGD